MDGTNALALIRRAKTELIEAGSLSKVMDIRDKAELVRAYLKQRGESLDAQNEAAEIKLWAERRAGELLHEMRESGEREGPGGDRKSKLQHATLNLRDLGIERTQAHRWQRSAVIPEESFISHIAGVKDRGGDLTSAGIHTLAKSLLKQETVEEVSQGDSAATESLESLIAAGKKFSTIYADPPWKYGNQGTRASTDNHYSTMTVEDIASLPIGDLVTDRAHLWLWTTNGFLFECPKLFDAWGFEFKSSYIWVKPQIGIGNYLRNSHEFLLLATRGGLVGAARNVKSWGEFDRTRHSAKPESIRTSVVEKVSPGPRLELFGRSTVQGWTVWGNQVAKSVFDTEVA